MIENCKNVQCVIKIAKTSNVLLKKKKKELFYCRAKTIFVIRTVIQNAQFIQICGSSR